MNKMQSMYDKWLKAEHLRGPVVAHVTMAEITSFDGQNGKEQRYLLHFHERNLKPLTLNKGNALAMLALTNTDDERQWCNVQVMLTPSKLANGNGTIILSAPPETPVMAHPPVATSTAGGRVEDDDKIPF